MGTFENDRQKKETAPLSKPEQTGEISRSHSATWLEKVSLPKKTSIQLEDGKELQIETGVLAGQASGAALVAMGDSVVLVTCMLSEEAKEGADFLPLLCDFEEKMYAAGKIPGGFIKREGRPSEYAILTSRLMDRPHRPLFPEGYFYDIQLVATPLSFESNFPLDVLAVNGASVALALSGAPIHSPVGCVRIGWDGKSFVLNPSFKQMGQHFLDLVVAGTEDSLVMIECHAKEVSERQLLDALEFAQPKIQTIVREIKSFAEGCGKPPLNLPLFKPDEELLGKLKTELAVPLLKLFTDEMSKQERDREIEKLKSFTKEKLAIDEDQEMAFNEAFHKVSKFIYREMVLEKEIRLNSRKPTDIRPISCEVNFLPRVHGSGLFTRGETQVLTLTTLGGLGEMQRIDSLTTLEFKRFMHQYNFPPFSVGEVRPLRGPGRREIGHGVLAEKALASMIPSEQEFPYAIRLVSEVLSSDGSTSMASTCGSTLSLMDAGVPIKAPVAGIAMGLIQGEDKSVILSDIQGIEDAFGDMDFKVAGTEKGVTALQMDIKIAGLKRDLLYKALLQAREGRLQILEKMLKTIDKPRPHVSPYAPSVITVQIPTDTIGNVIGPGGKTIKKIIDETGAQIDIEDDGKVYITAPSQESGERARKIIQDITREIHVGDILTGHVTKVLPFGAIVELAPGKDGMIHISQLSYERVEKVEDVLKVGDEVKVLVIGMDNGKVQLSRKALLKKQCRTR